MSNVSLMIGGRSYTVACAEGEENHVLGLGRMIDNKLAEMGDTSGQAEARSLLFAALLLADEVHEATNRQPVPSTPSVDQQISGRLNSLAARLENIASRLEA